MIPVQAERVGSPIGRISLKIKALHLLEVKGLILTCQVNLT
jgi:hypothetical protein